jgi:hypothetical protein
VPFYSSKSVFFLVFPFLFQENYASIQELLDMVKRWVKRMLKLAFVEQLVAPLAAVSKPLDPSLVGLMPLAPRYRIG